MGGGGAVGNHPAYLTSKDIQAELKQGVDDRQRDTLLRFELQYRMAMASIYLVFLGIGAPTGVILRKGTQLGALAVAIGFGLLYYVLSVELGRDIGRSGKVEPWVGAWFVPIVGSISAWIMMQRSLKR